MHTCLAKCFSLPSALVYHPSCRYLIRHFAICIFYHIVWHFVVASCQFLVFLFIHYRVHKEATCISLNLRVGEFLVAYFDDGISELLSCRRSYSFLLKLCAYISVVEMRSKGGTQTIGNMSNQIFILPLMLKYALAISVVAVGCRDSNHLACSNFYSFDTFNHILSFGSIGSDVLYRTCSHFAWYQRKVFHAVEPFACSKCHNIVKHQSCPTSYAHTIIVGAHTIF